MTDIKKFERLSKTEYGIIRNLVIEEGLVDNSEIECIIEQVTKDRFHLGKAKIEFARKLDVNDPEACKVIIALCYYAMYQAAGLSNEVYRNHVEPLCYRKPKASVSECGKEKA